VDQRVLLRPALKLWGGQDGKAVSVLLLMECTRKSQAMAAWIGSTLADRPRNAGDHVNNEEIK
jgi:hypothetical protein